MSQNLIIGNLYKRIELNENFNTSRFSSSREGILSIDNNIILFCTLEKALKDKQFHYNDYFENDFFRWDSQNPQHINTPMIQRMVKGEVEIFLFCRIFDKIKGSSQPFVYCGKLEFSEHFENTARPVHIIFESIEFQDRPNAELKAIYEWRPKENRINPKRKSVDYKISKRNFKLENGKNTNYTIDHVKVRDRLLKQTNYTCQGTELGTGKCDVRLQDHPHWLHLYHVNSSLDDNSPNNLKILCTSCYQKQPVNHKIKLLPRVRDEIARRRINILPPSTNKVSQKPKILDKNNLDSYKVIDLYAKNRAVKVYENSMYIVNDASTNDHFNLICLKEGYNPRRILVKATTGQGDNIILSEDEVKSARDKSSITDLFVVHSIIIQKEKNIFEVKSGKIKHLQNWEPNENALTPNQYNYEVPQ